LLPPDLHQCTWRLLHQAHVAAVLGLLCGARTVADVCARVRVALPHSVSPPLPAFLCPAVVWWLDEVHD
jgi:hypothetical protein